MTFTTTSEIAGRFSTAGSLPSSRTESILTNALDSDNLDDVKAALIHTWAHYQSLEFLLSDAVGNTTAIKLMLADPEVENDLEAIELATGFLSGPGIEMAYENAHAIGVLLAFGYTAPDALRAIYSDLDHSDPDRAPVTDVTEENEESADGEDG